MGLKDDNGALLGHHGENPRLKSASASNASSERFGADADTKSAVTSCATSGKPGFLSAIRTQLTVRVFCVLTKEST